MSTPLGRIAGSGALAGAAAGVAGAVALTLLVEPWVRRAIEIEEAGSVHGGRSVPGLLVAHGGDVVVSRSEQVVFGLVTVVVVGTLIGVAFAIAHQFLAPRLPGRTGAATVMTLAGLGFVAFTLAPAIVVPANPPAVGDPATVGLRTSVYLGSIVCATAATALVVGAARAQRLSVRQRVAASSLLGVVGVAVLMLALPDATDPVPSSVPADLVWSFRLASLAQLALMWLVLGTVFAWLTEARSGARRPRSSTLAAV